MPQTRDTYGSITALIRQTIDDRDQTGGIVFTDADLLAFVNAALLDLNMDLIRAGSPLVKSEFTVTFAALTDTTLDWATPGGVNVLPQDFLAPIELHEKLSTEPLRNYIQVSEINERLPDTDQYEQLRYWSWQGNQILTLGATSARSVRVFYWKQAPLFATAADVIPYPGARTVLAYDALYKAAMSRGELDFGNAVAQLYQKAYIQFKALAVRANQRRPRRRVGYGMRRFFRF